MRVKLIICDHCGAAVRVSDNNSLPRGWFHGGRDGDEKHFCSPACLQGYIQGLRPNCRMLDIDPRYHPDTGADVAAVFEMEVR